MEVLKAMTKTSIVTICVSLALLVGAVSVAAAAVPEVGQKASDVTLPSQDGTVVNVQKDFKGKWVVLYFYPKDNTRGCTIEAHNFETDLPKYNAKNAVIVGVSVDSVDSHKDFCAKQSLTFKLLSDTDKKVVEQYGSLNPTGVTGRSYGERTVLQAAPGCLISSPDRQTAIQ